MQAAGESVERKEVNGHEPIASCLLHAAAIFAECHREKTSGGNIMSLRESYEHNNGSYHETLIAIGD